MDQGRIDQRLSESGVSSVQFLLASMLSMLLFVAFANLIAVQYGTGALRSALEQAARAGSMTRSAADCTTVGEDVAGQLLSGRMGDDLVITCVLEGPLVRARATALFRGWSPFTGDFPVAVDVVATLEPER